MRVSKVFLVASVISSFCFAKTNPIHFQKANYKWLTKKEFKDKKLMAKRRSEIRKIANTVSEDMMSKEYRSFRDRYLKIENSQQYENLLVELETNYKKYPADLKYVAARMLPVRKLRGILYRLTPVVSKEKVTHSYFLTVVRRTVAQMRLFFPYDHADATFEYFAKPYKVNGEVVEQFETVQAFQEYLATDVYKDMIDSANRISEMDFSKTRILWDNKIMSGSESFTDDVARYRIIGEAERNATMFRLHRGMAFLNRFAAYNMERFMRYTKDMGKLYGVDGFFSEVDGAPSYKRVKIANKKRYRKLFTIMPNGKDWMAQSLKHIQESVKYLRVIYEELKDRPANSFQRINPIRVASWEREINSGLDTLEAIVNGPTELRSAVTGEVIKVNFPEFYHNPPKDLKGLLPIAWDIKNKEKKTGWTKMVKTGPKALKSSKPVTYRNYYWGRPTAWSSKGYKHYFPSIKNDQDIARHMRILRQSLGASTVGQAITDFSE